jgi:hypothetical protein
MPGKYPKENILHNFFTVVLASIRDVIFVAESYIAKSSSGILTRHKFGKKKIEVYLATLSWHLPGQINECNE